jgi:hypothetical protein
MATGGIFALITNDGKQDKMLMASDLLKTRLDAIYATRSQNPALDPTPTLLDIEKTHILFTNAHFKPFAAIGFEYNKTTASSGNTTLGSDCTFSIPQFGDFFHDMVLYMKIKQPVMNVTAANPSDQPLMRWCPYPGERILETVEFEVNGNPLDKYTCDDYTFYREFTLQPNKVAGWNRCVGQEEEEEGYLDQPNWANSGVSPSSITHRVVTRTVSGDQTPSGQKDITVYKELLIPLHFWCNTDVRLSVPSVAIPYGQRFIKCKLASPDKLVNLVPRGAGDWSDANIGGTLNYDGMLKTIELYINNIFVNPEVHNIFIKRIGFSLIRVHRQQTINCNTPTAQILLQQLKWPIETLFVGMKMNDYNSSDVTLRRQHLDKWHTFTQITPTTRATQGWTAGKVTLKDDSFDLPASLLNLSAAGKQLRLTVTSPVAGKNQFEGIVSGDVITLVLTPTNTTPAVAVPTTLTLHVADVVPDSTTAGYLEFAETVDSVPSNLGTTDIAVAANTPVSVTTSVASELTATVPVQTATIDDITITAHGVPIYNQFISKFYNAYVPYHYGGPNVTVPKSIGALMIPFSLYPGSYQPSGHINVSRAREFYISYNSSVISTVNVGNMIVSGSAINFLLISDGSAVLRYTT